MIDLVNDTDVPEQLHWHGQTAPVDVDGAAEEGTPYIPARGTRRIAFTPGPAGLRFYHTHLMAGDDLGTPRKKTQQVDILKDADIALAVVHRDTALVVFGHQHESR